MYRKRVLCFLTAVVLCLSVLAPGASAVSGPGIHLHEGLLEIEEEAFANIGAKRIDLPESLRAIAGDAFAGTENPVFLTRRNSFASEWVNQNYPRALVELPETNHPEGQEIYYFTISMKETEAAHLLIHFLRNAM